jgi:hypothetical protein
MRRVMAQWLHSGISRDEDNTMCTFGVFICVSQLYHPKLVSTAWLTIYPYHMLRRLGKNGIVCVVGYLNSAKSPNRQMTTYPHCAPNRKQLKKLCACIQHANV